ncbi:MAG: VPLPA-CTERM sorting domain-containing protein [Desulfobacteraceae bacterium]|nr:VPLPA-CTERM sorting domain-containing protein [Desulfobacteraceae bacterium]
MKKYIICIIASVFCLLGNAYAANISFDITSDYTIGDDTVTFDFLCTTDTDVQVIGYTFDFKYDENELVFESHENLATSVFSGFATYDDLLKRRSSPGSLNWFGARHQYDQDTLEAGTTKLGSFRFSLTENTILDGTTDFKMDKVTYMNLQKDGTKISGTTALGPVSIDGSLTFMTDVGGTSAVPVPAAVWLLGSGLLGLMGIRRKNA